MNDTTDAKSSSRRAGTRVAGPPAATRDSHRIHGWLIAVVASIVLWAAIIGVAWMIVSIIA